MTQINREWLTNGPWEWLNDQGYVYANNFRLGLDGNVTGYSHPNESKWTFDGSAISILDTHGNLSCQLTRDHSREYESWSGLFLGDPSLQIKHILRKKLPKIGCYLRTHFWDNSVEQAYDLLGQTWGDVVGIASDQSHEFVTPYPNREIAHNISDLNRIGLLSVPQGVSPLWYNSDYVLSHLMLNTDYDYIIMTEYDLAIKNINLQALAASMAFNGHDLVMSHLKPAEANWHYTARQQEWQNAEYPGSPSQIFSSFFPFVFISRIAALYLFGRRIQMANLLRHGMSPTIWPYCESFVPTELNRAGFKIADLSQFYPDLSLTYLEAKSWAEIDATDVCFVHPVHENDSFIAKLCGQAKWVNGDRIEQAAWLKTQLHRNISSNERALLEKAIQDLYPDI